MCPLAERQAIFDAGAKDIVFCWAWEWLESGVVQFVLDFKVSIRKCDLFILELCECLEETPSGTLKITQPFSCCRKITCFDKKGDLFLHVLAHLL